MKTRVSIWFMTSLLSLPTSAGVLDSFEDAMMEFYAGIRSSCERLITTVRNSQAQKVLVDAVISGEAKKIGTVTENHPGLLLHFKVSGLVMGERYDLKYFQRMLQTGDALYAFAGIFFRYRAKDDTIFIIPEILEQQMADVHLLTARQIMEIHASYPEKHLFPSHPLLALFKNEFAGPYSEWDIKRGQLIYDVQLQAFFAGAQAGYFNLKIVFFDQGRIEMSILPRTDHPADRVYESRRKVMIEAMNHTDLADLFATIKSGRPLVFHSDRELVAQLDILQKHRFELRSQY